MLLNPYIYCMEKMLWMHLYRRLTNFTSHSKWNEVMKVQAKLVKSSPVTFSIFHQIYDSMQNASLTGSTYINQVLIIFLSFSGNQEVTGSKTFDTLTLQDDLVITGTLSGEDVSDINDNAVFIAGDQVIGGRKTFTSATTFQDVTFNSKLNLKGIV